MEFILGASLMANVFLAAYIYLNRSKPVVIPREVIDETIFGVSNEISSHLAKPKGATLSLVDFEEPMDEDELAYFEKQKGGR